MEYLAIQSDAPGTERLVLVDGPPYDPWVVIGDIDVGAAQWETTFGAPHGTRGAMVAGDRVGNRQVVMTLRGSFSSKAEAAGYENDLALALDECRRFGGWLIYRVHGGTRRTWWRVLAREYGMEPWGQRFDRVNELRPRIVLTVEPYPYGDPLDHDDRFTSTATWSDYRAVAPGGGVLTDLTVAGDGFIAPAAGAVGDTFYVLHDAGGGDIGDTEARLHVKPGSASTSWSAGVILKYIDDETWLVPVIKHGGGNWYLTVLGQYPGVGVTEFGSTAPITAPVAGTPYWLQGRIEGHTVTVEWGSGPLPLTSPTVTHVAHLSAAAAGYLGAGAKGKAGFYMVPQSTADRFDRFMVAPYTYRNVTRYPIEVNGDVPGTAPAVLEVDMDGSGGPWLMMAWSPRPSPWNRIHNEGMEVVASGLSGGGTTGWSVASVSGVTGAATSVSRVTTAAYEGDACGQVVCPATANTGVTFRMKGQFTPAKTYRFRVRVRAASATTNLRVRLGVSGNIASSTAAALSATWVERTVDWTPNSDATEAYACIEITAATGTTFQFDKAEVYPVDDGAPVSSGRGLAGAPAWGYLDGLNGFTASGSPTSATLSSEPYAQLDLSVSSLGESYAIAWALDPNLVPQDDHAGPTRDVEVWARLLMSNAFDGGVTAVLSIAGGVYTYEWGTDGVSLVMPNAVQAFRIYRLGTIPMPDVTGEAGSTLLQLGFDVAAGTNNVAIGVDGLWLVNPRARVLTPTGIDPDSGYPALAPSGRVNPQGMVTGVRNGSHQHLGSLSGAIELPTGPVEFLLLHSDAVPDAPTPGGAGAFTVSGSESYTPADVHLSVRPRFEFLIAEE